MRDFLLTLLAVYFFLMPLQWQFPESLQSLLSRLTWNGEALLLALVLLSGYVFCLYSRHFSVNKKSVLVATGLTVIIMGYNTWFTTLPPQPTTVWRLVGIIWLMPLLNILYSHYHKQTLVVLMLSILGLHAWWGIAQFMGQQDLGLHVIGEAQINAYLPGVAKFATPLGKIIRPYGPYPHANSYGGVLVIGFGLLLLGHPLVSARFTRLLALTLALGIWLSFSRSAWLAASLVVLVIFQYKTSLVRTLKTTASFILLSALAVTPLTYSRLTDPEDQGVAARITGLRYAGELISDNVWYGVGAGNYQQALKEYLATKNIRVNSWDIAPVHSVPLLLLAEWGIVGLGLLVVYGYIAIGKRPTFHIAYLPLLPLLLFDHYLLTQTAPLLWLLFYWRYFW